jgi:hypothetical protein
MFREEKIINGILHYRTSPDSDFKPYTLENLTNKVEMLKEIECVQNNKNNEILDFLKTIVSSENTPIAHRKMAKKLINEI